LSLRSKPLKVSQYGESLLLLLQAARRASRPRRFVTRWCFLSLRSSFAGGPFIPRGRLQLVRHSYSHVGKVRTFFVFLAAPAYATRDPTARGEGSHPSFPWYFLIKCQKQFHNGTSSIMELVRY